MKPFTEVALFFLLLIATTFLCVKMIYWKGNADPESEKLQLEIQHLKYQVGIDSLRYDLELNFYEKRHGK